MQNPVCFKKRLAVALDEKVSKGYYLYPGRTDSSLVDFSSNDYLGLARPESSFQYFLNASTALTSAQQASSSTGSRILTGNSKQMVELEAIAAKFHQAEAAILFNSGYDANLAILSALPNRNDAVVYDELVHASSHDGMRLSQARKNTSPFRHNDIDSLHHAVSKAFSKHSGVVFVCVETVYSMNGDVCPIRKLLDTCEQLSVRFQRDVLVIADEAHSGGFFGENGEGLVVSENMQRHPNLLALVVTFGKAFAAHGAVIVGPKVMIRYLYNHGRPFIFSTALPPHSVTVLTEMYRFAKTKEAREARRTLWKRIETFQKLALQHLPTSMLPKTNGQSAVQVLLVPGSKQVKRMNSALLQKGYGTYSIYTPAVAQGEERIRIVIHSDNTDTQIEGLVRAAAEAAKQKQANL